MDQFTKQVVGKIVAAVDKKGLDKIIKELQSTSAKVKPGKDIHVIMHITVQESAKPKKPTE